LQLPDTFENNLNSLLDQSEFVHLTINQINKDLQGLISEDDLLRQPVKENFITELLDELTLRLNTLSRSQPELLSQFIYRVDLPENKFIESLQIDISLKQLALLVLEREAFKVYLKKKFS
jgi:hypothetical protein